MVPSILAISSAFSLALCAMSFYLWIKSMADNNFWDSPAILHLGGLPAVYVAVLAAIVPSVSGWLWYRERRRKTAFRGFEIKLIE